MELQHGNEGILNCPLSGLRTSVSEMTVSSVSMAMPSTVANPFLSSSSAWDPLVPLTQTFEGSLMVSDSEFANSSYSHVLENERVSYEYQFVQCISDSVYVDMAPKVPSFDQTGASEFGIKRGSINNEQYKNEGETGSACGEHRRKRGLVYDYTLSPNKNAEGEAVKDSTEKGSDDVKEQCEKKPKVEQNSSANLIGKQSMKPKKDDSDNGEAPKENFIHLRARRGQATNSHSLAERVRREKISERMKLLQELVPGCDKITGKAVMLDEIINYVQSLQLQIKFLSMKLATVNQELNFNVEQMRSKDPHIGHGPIGGYGPGISYTRPSPSMPQCILDQSFYRMSYKTSTDLDKLGNSGC